MFDKFQEEFGVFGIYNSNVLLAMFAILPLPKQLPHRK
jgi:hypothetical protein